MRGLTPVRSANPSALAASAAASSGVSFTPASGVIAQSGASPVSRACSSAASSTSSRGLAFSIGISLRLTSARALEIDSASRTLGRSRASLRMPEGTPAVHTVIALASMAIALGSHSTPIASSTRSTFESGSPIPWNTTPCTRCPMEASRLRRTIRTCSMISQVSRLRRSPSLPVAQNAHARAHPTCELTHAENRPARSSGMRTDSMRSPSPVCSRNFLKGSRLLARSDSVSSPCTTPAALTASMLTRLTPCRGVPGGSSRWIDATIFRASASVTAGMRSTIRSGVRACSGIMAARSCPPPAPGASPAPSAAEPGLEGVDRVLGVEQRRSVVLLVDLDRLDLVPRPQRRDDLRRRRIGRQARPRCPRHDALERHAAVAARGVTRHHGRAASITHHRLHVRGLQGLERRLEHVRERCVRKASPRC
jgi:hypothetical protein